MNNIDKIRQCLSNLKFTSHAKEAMLGDKDEMYFLRWRNCQPKSR
jgi:hypothetical protein